ncbi:hypothetical protein MTBBW1_1380066 [Desulfamplus magnetovallimortis]|uniref:SpoVT-AbrB domain-containing protein n=1 Tax=Desulfamplus magnetovallimortis TaxID=1246637 RepID=A0A1W1H7S7_9BACT|nr:AbrB/MazE/SpoVT family DNA-binding domain-containing protein [Desulfamplus magnetovallimortis]SLM28519.1 hypothetical protein MTBBW1_1380066 [Desulfamplus magnetovallimortis]
MPLVKVNKHHQIVIPLEIRKRYKITPGDYLEVDDKQGDISLTPVRVVQSRREEVFQDIFGIWKKTKDEPLEEIESLVDEAVQHVKQNSHV